MTKFKLSPKVQMKRRGVSLIELIFAIVLLGLAIRILMFPALRVQEIFDVVECDWKYRKSIAAGASVLAAVWWLVVIRSLYRTRKRYADLLYFPLMVGPPVGFGVVPFAPFSLLVYLPLVVLSICGTSMLLFGIQAVFLKWIRKDDRKRYPIPEKLLPYPPDFVPQRSKSDIKVKDFPPHPNVTQAWVDYQNNVGIHGNRAREAFLLDNNIDEFRAQWSTYCRKQLDHYENSGNYLQYWSRDSRLTEELLAPFASGDVELAREWAVYVRKTMPSRAYVRSKHDEILVSAYCASVLEEPDEFRRFYDQLQKPLGWLDSLEPHESEYWTILLNGIAHRDIETCREAIRIQSEKWYSPSFSQYCRLNIEGLAMTMFCLYCNLDVPTLEPVIPATLCRKIGPKPTGLIFRIKN